MKKFFIVVLACVMLLSFAACNKAETTQSEQETVSTPQAHLEKDNAIEDAQTPAEDDAAKKDESDSTTETTKPETKPEATKPEGETTQQGNQTVGNILLADFKSKVAGADSMLSLAESLIAHDMIPFMGGANEIEPGLLAGFGNTEIKGFKSGASFGPMMGTQPFIGYVFELESGADVNAFISTLKSNADLRWNVCTEAEEMVAGNVGNKVFFVMCPKQFEE